MSIRIVIANDDDILFNSLSNIVSQYKESKIELENVPINKLNAFIDKIKLNENLIVLDCTSPVSFYNNVIRNTVNRIGKKNIIILVIDSKKITNTKNQENTHIFFNHIHHEFSTLDIIEIIADSIKDTLEIEKKLDSTLWKLGFTSYFKGTIYLKDAILLAYYNDEILKDMNVLVKKIAEKNKISNEKIVRSAMDKALNTTLDYIDINVIHDIFGEDYDGRKISVKYFIDLCIRYLEKQRYCCLSY